MKIEEEEETLLVYTVHGLFRASQCVIHNTHESRQILFGAAFKKPPVSIHQLRTASPPRASLQARRRKTPLFNMLITFLLVFGLFGSGRHSVVRCDAHVYVCKRKVVINSSSSSETVLFKGKHKIAYVEVIITKGGKNPPKVEKIQFRHRLAIIIIIIITRATQ